RVKVDRGRRLVHPAGLQLLQAVLAQVIIGLAWAVVIGSHCDLSPSKSGARSLRGCNAPEAFVVPESGGEFCHSSPPSCTLHANRCGRVPLGSSPAAGKPHIPPIYSRHQACVFSPERSQRSAWACGG